MAQRLAGGICFSRWRDDGCAQSRVKTIGNISYFVACVILLYIRMRYEWDPEKNRRNRRKHGGISFELAALVFENERCLLAPDCIDGTEEQRWHTVGAVCVESQIEAPQIEAVLVVAHVYRKDKLRGPAPPADSPEFELAEFGHGQCAKAIWKWEAVWCA